LNLLKLSVFIVATLMQHLTVLDRHYQQPQESDMHHLTGLARNWGDNCMWTVQVE